MERKKEAFEGRKKSLLLMTFSRLKEDKLAVLGMIIFLIMILAALLAPLIAPYSYKEQDLQNVLASPSAQHFFGTDSLGRDIFSRALYGAKYSLSIGVISVGVAMLFGCVIGSICGYYGGWADMVIMRIMIERPMLIISRKSSSWVGSGMIKNKTMTTTPRDIALFSIRFMRRSPPAP